jgi:hypothetical protein
MYMSIVIQQAENVLRKITQYEYGIRLRGTPHCSIRWKHNEERGEHRNINVEN